MREDVFEACYCFEVPAEQALSKILQLNLSRVVDKDVVTRIFRLISTCVMGCVRIE